MFSFVLCVAAFIVGVGLAWYSYNDIRRSQFSRSFDNELEDGEDTDPMLAYIKNELKVQDAVKALKEKAAEEALKDEALLKEFVVLGNGRLALDLTEVNEET